MFPRPTFNIHSTRSNHLRPAHLLSSLLPGQDEQATVKRAIRIMHIAVSHERGTRILDLEHVSPSFAPNSPLICSYLHRRCSRLDKTTLH
jgi:hypothetical protein